MSPQGILDQQKEEDDDENDDENEASALDGG
jgi:hypothetical protein